MEKKILFINSSLTDGGSERVMTLLANNFANKENYKISMILVRQKQEETYKLDDKINCIRIKYKYQNRLFKAIKRIYKIRKIMKKNNYDAIISFMYDINFITLLAGIGLNKKIIISERGNPKKENKKNIMIPILRKSLYLLCYKIVFQTEQAKEFFPRYISKKGVIIPNPVSKDLPSRQIDKIQNKIIAVGRLVEQKNFSMLLNSFYEFHKHYPNYELYIYGDGGLRNSLEHQIKKMELKDNVFLPGFVLDVNERMKNAKMYISTSNYEGISNSMIESLAMGVPTICTDCPVGGAKMMIKNNINGILIPVGDEDALLKAMLKIAKDEKFSLYLSNNALKVREEFSIDNILKKWEEIFV